MTATAILYDIHGNLPALEAVLTQVQQEGATDLVLGGDYALFGAWPAETAARLHELPNATWIRGNVDRWCANPEEAGSDALLQGAIADCRRVLGEVVTGGLGSLPEQHVAGGIQFCHASPISDLRSFMPDPAEDEDELLTGATERRLVFGHTHLQFRRARPDGIELTNPGSVGMPLDGDHRAAYGLLLDDGAIELRRVAYDHEAAAGALRDRFGDSDWVRRSEHRLRAAAP